MCYVDWRYFSWLPWWYVLSGSVWRLDVYLVFLLRLLMNRYILGMRILLDKRDYWDLCCVVFDTCLDIAFYVCNYYLVVYVLVIVCWYVVDGKERIVLELFVVRILLYVMYVKFLLYWNGLGLNIAVCFCRMLVRLWHRLFLVRLCLLGKLKLVGKRCMR